jgi:hypothetical protein
VAAAIAANLKKSRREACLSLMWLSFVLSNLFPEARPLDRVECRHSSSLHPDQMDLKFHRLVRLELKVVSSHNSSDTMTIEYREFRLDPASNEQPESKSTLGKGLSREGTGSRQLVPAASRYFSCAVGWRLSKILKNNYCFFATKRTGQALF